MYQSDNMNGEGDCTACAVDTYAASAQQICQNCSENAHTNTVTGAEFCSKLLPKYQLKCTKSEIIYKFFMSAISFQKVKKSLFQKRDKQDIDSRF